MVFLFIAFCVIIFLFSVPINIGFSYVSQDIYKKSHFCLFIRNKVKILPKISRNTFSDKSKIGKIMRDTLLGKPDMIFKNIGRLGVNKISLQSTIPYTGNAAIIYPFYGIMYGLVAVSDDKKDHCISVDIAERFYLQIKIEFQWNLHLIFSLLLQILSAQRSRKWR